MTKKHELDFQIQIEILKEENQRLRKMLSQSITNVTGFSDEESICLIQLKLLKELATMRDLTLDEVKKFDILNKNLRQIKAAASTIVVASPAGQIDTDQLLRIANDED